MSSKVGGAPWTGLGVALCGTHHTIVSQMSLHVGSWSDESVRSGERLGA